MKIENQEYKVISLNDESLNLAKSHELKSAIDNEIAAGSKFIAFDLKELNSINSSGLGVLIGILNKLKSAGGNLKILNISDRILNIFKITKLDLVFEIKN